MILWLTVAHTSLFNTPHQDFFLIKSGREAFFVSFMNCYQQTFLVSFYLILLHLSAQILMLEIHSFKPLHLLGNAIIDKNCENQLR